VPRSPVVQRTVRRGTLELSVSEARQLVLYPLTLSDGRGRTITLPAGVRRGDEITLLYDGHPVVLTVQVEGLDRS
jgi:hypothetical protein